MAEEIKQQESAPAGNQAEQPAKTYTEEEYNALKSQLDTANSTIKSYEDMDIDGIKKSVEDYKNKFSCSVKSLQFRSLYCKSQDIHHLHSPRI